MQNQSVSILFSGYAPVHFVCFQPIYDQLHKMPGIEIFLSGGTRELTDKGIIYDPYDLYAPFDVKRTNIITVKEANSRHFNIVFSSCTNIITTGTYDVSVQMFHGNSFRNRAIRGENANYDYYFMIGPYMKRNFSESEILDRDDPRILNIGFMKTDKMLNGTWKRDEMIRHFGFDGSRPVILYAPTGQKYNSLETMGLKVIKNLCESNRYDLLIKPHDHPKNDQTELLNKIKTMESNHCILTQEKDVTKCLFVAELLITDASSVSSEYSLLDRPMVFLDVPKLLEKARKREDSKIDLQTWGRRAGKIVTLPEELVNTIDYSLEHRDEMSEIRQQMATDLYYNPGRSTEVASHWVKNKIHELKNLKAIA